MISVCTESTNSSSWFHNHMPLSYMYKRRWVNRLASLAAATTPQSPPHSEVDIKRRCRQRVKERKTETERSTLFDGALDKYLPRLPLAYTKMEK